MVNKSILEWIKRKGYSGEPVASLVWMWINKNTSFWIICVPEVVDRKFHCEYYYEDELIDYRTGSYENFEEALLECFDEISNYEKDC